MSGGAFNYTNLSLKRELFDKENNNLVFEDIELKHLFYEMLELVEKYDYYISGDIGQETYDKHRLEFKNKWLNKDPESRNLRLKEIVLKECEELKIELSKLI